MRYESALLKYCSVNCLLSIMVQSKPVNTNRKCPYERDVRSVLIKQVEFREGVRARDKENCPLITRRPY